MAIGDQNSKKKSTISLLAPEVLALLTQFLSAVISSLVAAWLVQDILRYNFTLTVLVAFALFFLLTLILQTRWLHLQLKTFFVFAAMLTFMIFQAILIAWLYISTQPPTVYLVFDATENTEPIFNDIIKNITFASQIQNPNTISGLRVFGGNVKNSSCDDTLQLIKPVPLKEYEKQLNLIIGSIKPQGHASLTIAILETLKDDLKKSKGPIKIIIISSGLDKFCEPQEGGIFEANAKDIQQNIRDDITVVIISVGVLKPDEIEVLNRYAHAYHGTHLNTITLDALPSFILAPPSYFTNYSSYLMATSTP